MTSEVYPLTSKLVSETQRKLVDMVVSWSFISAGPPFEAQKYDGTPIRYQGIEFAGSPQQVFWSGYIEPYLENHSLKILEQVGKTAYECDVSIESATQECRSALNGMIAKVYRHMADVDSRLMGNGFQPAPKRCVLGHVSRMEKIISGHTLIIKKKYENISKTQGSSNVTNNFNAPIENVQAGNNNSLINVKSSSSKSLGQWLMDNIVSVVLTGVVSGLLVLWLAGWLGFGG
ncbi:hypothetical protein GTG28_10710 [Vibrio sp. OCN044]|uniref:Uncharacterized protein n=1 Tax=Vibrio tetraodonis subsp. pristinus TaxID=2695891 RepID=A0A6L8M2C6_9VIBR|nr:hypothetical protein [Vibrio tetraodonis]MYM59692.1 hypothetical protein [Vibrio tetraodonis subsp. pristinus]